MNTYTLPDTPWPATGRQRSHAASCEASAWRPAVPESQQQLSCVPVSHGVPALTLRFADSLFRIRSVLTLEVVSFGAIGVLTVNCRYSVRLNNGTASASVTTANIVR